MSKSFRLCALAATVALPAMLAGGAAAGSLCRPQQWLEDPGISPGALAANGYRVVASHTVVLDDGRQAIEWIWARERRVAKCRTVYPDDAEHAEAGNVCFLPCRRP